MKSIALVIPWYGPFHNYFDLWIKSAAYNETIDFFIITDNSPVQNIPKNIHFVNIKFSELKKRFEECAGFQIKFFPYKLCDFKPLYGLAFQDLIGAYDYWGHCDVDLIFGDIRHFLTDDILSVERVLQRGHFSLYKNNEKMNHLYEKTALKDNMAYSYQKAWTTNYSCYFDEFLGMNIVTDIYCSSIIDHRIEKIALDPPAHLYPLKSSVSDRNYYCIWDNGHLYKQEYNDSPQNIVGEKQEFMYVHLQKRQMSRDSGIENENLFYIIPNKFVRTPEFCITDDEAMQYTKNHFIKDKKKNLNKLLKFGAVECFFHRMRRRKIDQWLKKNKPNF